MPGARARTAHSVHVAAEAGQWHADWYTVVGVTADVRNGQGLTDEPNPEIYVVGPARDDVPVHAGRLSLRTTARPADAAAFLRQIAADLDPTQLVTIETSR